MNKNNTAKKKSGLAFLGRGVMPMFLTLILLIIISVVMSSNFLKLTNIMNVLRQVSTNGVIAIGMTFVILTGGIDLTVGSVVACVSVCVAMLQDIPAVPAFVIGILIGVVCGLISGVIIHYRKMQPFIVTLAKMQIVKGVAYLISGGHPIVGVSDGLNKFGSGYVGPMPLPAVTMLVLFIIAYLLLDHTYYGRSIYAIGGNEEAARLSGTKVGIVKVSAYVISGFCAALASLMIVSRLQAGEPQVGNGYEMDAIASVAIGGTSMAGGVGSILGTFIGVLILGILNNMFNLLNLNAYVQDVVKGIIILVAVLLTTKDNKK